MSSIVVVVHPSESGPMPHYKCVTCTTRLMAAGRLPGTCEGCGAVLEPVTGLSELVGYRLVAPHGDERFEQAVAMALQGLDTAEPGPYGDRSTR
jgi:hypothetical protein